MAHGYLYATKDIMLYIFQKPSIVLKPIAKSMIQKEFSQRINLTDQEQQNGNWLNTCLS